MKNREVLDLNRNDPFASLGDEELAESPTRGKWQKQKHRDCGALFLSFPNNFEPFSPCTVLMLQYFYLYSDIYFLGAHPNSS